MKPFIAIILIAFALANGHSDDGRKNSHTAAHRAMHNININDINNIADSVTKQPAIESTSAVPSSSSYTKNVFNNSVSNRPYIVTPEIVVATTFSSSPSSSSSSSVAASSSPSPSPSPVYVASNASIVTSTPSSRQSGSSDVAVTIPTDASTLRDKRGKSILSFIHLIA